MAEEHIPDQTLTIREAAEKLDIHRDTVRRAILQGKLQAQKIVGEFGPEWRTSDDALQDYIRASSTSSPSQEGLSPVRDDRLVHLIQGLAEGVQKAQGEQRERLDVLIHEQPRIYELVLKLARARHEADQARAEIEQRDAQIARLQEELAAERRKTWWQKLRRR